MVVPNRRPDRRGRRGRRRLYARTVARGWAGPRRLHEGERRLPLLQGARRRPDLHRRSFCRLRYWQSAARSSLALMSVFSIGKRRGPGWLTWLANGQARPAPTSATFASSSFAERGCDICADWSRVGGVVANMRALRGGPRRSCGDVRGVLTRLVCRLVESVIACWRNLVYLLSLSQFERHGTGAWVPKFMISSQRVPRCAIFDTGVFNVQVSKPLPVLVQYFCSQSSIVLCYVTLMWHVRPVMSQT